jgi:hypothetical protein
MPDNGDAIKAEEWSTYRHGDVGVLNTLLFWSSRDNWVAVLDSERAALRIRRPTRYLVIGDLVSDQRDDQRDRAGGRYVRGGELRWRDGTIPSSEALLEAWVTALVAGCLTLREPCTVEMGDARRLETIRGLYDLERDLR